MLIDEYFQRLQQTISHCPVISSKTVILDINSHERIFRYDNAKHYPDLGTFPHHRHVGPETAPDKVAEASEKSLEEVLREIEHYIIVNK